jgi:hypothetical protein
MNELTLPTYQARRLHLEQLTLRAAAALNDELLTSDSAWGYSGSKEDFDRLYRECFAIARDEVDTRDSIDEILDTYWDIQLEVMNGHRAVDWYL